MFYLHCGDFLFHLNDLGGEIFLKAQSFIVLLFCKLLHLLQHQLFCFAADHVHGILHLLVYLPGNLRVQTAQSRVVVVVEL